jgi:hypothetical protein
LSQGGEQVPLDRFEEDAGHGVLPVEELIEHVALQDQEERREACGGTLTQAFAEWCKSVFAPLGARIRARRLVAMARAFGFGERLKVPAGKPSTISPRRRTWPRPARPAPPDTRGLDGRDDHGTSRPGQGTPKARVIIAP